MHLVLNRPFRNQQWTTAHLTCSCPATAHLLTEQTCCRAFQIMMQSLYRACCHQLRLPKNRAKYLFTSVPTGMVQKATWQISTIVLQNERLKHLLQSHSGSNLETAWSRESPCSSHTALAASVISTPASQRILKSLSGNGKQCSLKQRRHCKKD